MRQAVIVSTSRTPVGKAYKRAYNNTNAPKLGGFGIKNAVEKAGISPETIDDVIMGFGMQQGTTGGSISIGHTYGKSGSRVLGRALIEGKQRVVKYVVSTISIIGGMGAAGLFEIT